MTRLLHEKKRWVTPRRGPGDVEATTSRAGEQSINGYVHVSSMYSEIDTDLERLPRYPSKMF
jgi:hypothetical protein